MERTVIAAIGAEVTVVELRPLGPGRLQVGPPWQEQYVCSWRQGPGFATFGVGYWAGGEGMTEQTENWRLILTAAKALTAAGQTPFTRISVYEWIWRRYPRSSHDRPSLDPTFQGMIRGATGGPKSLAGTPLIKIDRGRFVLADPVGQVEMTRPARGMPARSRARIGGPPLTEDEVKQGAKDFHETRGFTSL